MRTTLGLIRRNIRVYYRDRGQVVLSLIAPLILLLLYILFLGNLQVDTLKGSLPGASDEEIDFRLYLGVRRNGDDNDSDHGSIGFEHLRGGSNLRTF